MTAPKYPLTPEQRLSLMTEVGVVEAAFGPDFEVACNADHADHAHARRIGLVGEAHSRVGLMVHSNGSGGSILIHPTEARALAAALLNIADELDGTTPLVFFPREKDAEG